MDFRLITPCGECCEGCKKKADGHCEEWAGSGVCPAYACCKDHGALFCGVCPEFPCDHLPMMKWRPDCVRELTALAEKYTAWKALPRLYCLELGYNTDKRREGFHIGLFASLEEAQAVSLRYRREVMGFNRPDITEEITEVPLLGTSELPCCVYRWQGYDVDDELDECNMVESPCYADESAAQASLANAKRDISRQVWVLNRYVIGQCDWAAGFGTST